ncbi:MAG: hypothetical protein R2867_05645 [Caldilineaceae bacterium]
MGWANVAGQSFGMAMEYNRSVLEVIGDRLALTMIVSVAAVVFSLGWHCRLYLLGGL